MNQQLACGTSALQWFADRNPGETSQFIASLIKTFPGNLALIRQAALRAAVVPLFIERAALICAALQTKTERHDFRRQLEGGLASVDLERFDQLMSAEWCRLRGK
ncbi:hypothetical protein [Paraburkholderia bryophila]|uniref:Uncharacterized protein n=1 Tax=Paraburkholderia bryophila TaxID=420952 RepID=A0A7Z0AXG9_9BURK|nr:hypothetical protein [Paraburkholderia bryophila]